MMLHLFKTKQVETKNEYIEGWCRLIVSNGTTSRETTEPNEILNNTKRNVFNNKAKGLFRRTEVIFKANRYYSTSTHLKERKFCLDVFSKDCLDLLSNLTNNLVTQKRLFVRGTSNFNYFNYSYKSNRYFKWNSLSYEKMIKLFSYEFKELNNAVHIFFFSSLLIKYLVCISKNKIFLLFNEFIFFKLKNLLNIIFKNSFNKLFNLNYIEYFYIFNYIYKRKHDLFLYKSEVKNLYNNEKVLSSLKKNLLNKFFSKYWLRGSYVHTFVMKYMLRFYRNFSSKEGKYVRRSFKRYSFRKLFELNAKNNWLDNIYKPSSNNNLEKKIFRYKSLYKKYKSFYNTSNVSVYRENGMDKSHLKKKIFQKRSFNKQIFIYQIKTLFHLSKSNLRRNLFLNNILKTNFIFKHNNLKKTLIKKCLTNWYWEKTTNAMKKNKRFFFKNNTYLKKNMRYASYYFNSFFKYEIKIINYFYLYLKKSLFYLKSTDIFSMFKQYIFIYKFDCTNINIDNLNKLSINFFLNYNVNFLKS